MRKRSSYKPRPVNPGSALQAITNSFTISKVNQMLLLMKANEDFACLKKQVEPRSSWSDLADALNISEQLQRLGIGNEVDHQQIAMEAQQAMSNLAVQYKVRQSWTMTSGSIEAIGMGLELYAAQLAICSQGEYARARDNVIRLVREARAGNVPKNVTVHDV